MCGIVGAVAKKDVVAHLLAGLQGLEYRGYDSAGIAVINAKQQLNRVRIVGKVIDLQNKLKQHPIYGNIGIVHTRWATHGTPVEKNAHPHLSNNRIAVVHNGIIENYVPLRQLLEQQGYQFLSETDTEVIAHLIHFQLQTQPDFLQAVRATLAELTGSYSIAIIDTQHPDKIIACRHASPLVIGMGQHANWLASDQLALLSQTQKFTYLEEGDIAEITAEKVIIYDNKGKKVQRAVQHSDLKNEAIALGKYRHFMEKEIFQQPEAIATTLEGHLADNHLLMESFGEAALALLPKVKHIQIVACGTSYHAGLTAKYWLEQYAKLPCSVDIASEFRYRKIIVPANSLFITISQSGETADTLAALQIAKTAGYLGTLTICNMPQSSLIRESDITLMTCAGPEIGVASTKAFTTQLTALLLLTLLLGKLHAHIDEKIYFDALHALPALITKTLATSNQIAKIAAFLTAKQHALFVGRGSLFPIALEGALKLKEISYIHAEAYAAGELKHGPLALIDAEMPVVAIASDNALIEKLLSNLQEVQARGGELFIFADEKLELSLNPKTHIVRIPSVPDIIAPIIYTIPLQLLAYHVALCKGTDIDKPRNLAKSVTVE